MTLLDAYALLAFLFGERATADVRALLREGDAAVPTVNLVEVLDVAERAHGVPCARTFEVLEPLLDGPLRAVPLELGVAVRAAQIRARHYHRTRRPISLADAVLVATAGDGDRIATADPDVLAVAELEGIARLALPSTA